MRFAYADPPYPGQSRKHYGDHSDFAGEVDYAELIARLEEEFPDGWTLSTNAKSLKGILDLCPAGEDNPKRPGTVKEGTGVRVLAWVKPMHTYFDGLYLQYGWEPVILRRGRREPTPGQRPRDFLILSPEMIPNASKPAGHVTGRKPKGFCDWIFACLGARAEDEVVDLFPGSGAVGYAWEAWKAQPSLLTPAPAGATQELLTPEDEPDDD